MRKRVKERRNRGKEEQKEEWMENAERSQRGRKKTVGEKNKKDGRE